MGTAAILGATVASLWLLLAGRKRPKAQKADARAKERAS
jgi:hypothetical protein